MIPKSYKWIAFGIITLALCVWLVHVSLIHAAVGQQLTDKTKEREAQLHTLATFKEMPRKITTSCEREEEERHNLEKAFKVAHYHELMSQLVDSFEMPTSEFSLYTNDGLKSGFFLLNDKNSYAIAYVRTVVPDELQDHKRQALLTQTIEFPDRKMILPAKLYRLNQYDFETSGSAGELKLGCRLKMLLRTNSSHCTTSIASTNRLAQTARTIKESSRTASTKSPTGGPASPTKASSRFSRSAGSG